MQIEFDPRKRALTLRHRGLDFADCLAAFSGLSFTFADARKAYGEDHFITLAFLGQRLVVIVRTPRGAARRIISMRKANAREIEKFNQALDRSG